MKDLEKQIHEANADKYWGFFSFGFIILVLIAYSYI